MPSQTLGGQVCLSPMNKSVPKRGRGRPALPAREKLSTAVLVRLPPDLAALLEAEAESRGESLATTARDLIADALFRDD